MDLRVSWHGLQYLHLSDYGAVGDGIADDNAAVIAWLTACWQQNRPGYAGPGTYMVTEVSVFPTNDLTILCHHDAIFKGTAGSFLEVIEIDGGTIRPSLTWNGGRIDNSLRIYRPADASGTALAFKRLDVVLLENMEFFSTDNFRDGMGDSGISEILCSRITVRKCGFRGQPDLGVYFSGGNDPTIVDDYGELTVEDCWFYHCAAGVSSKRETRRTNIINNKFIDCRVGIVMGSTGGLGSPTHPEQTPTDGGMDFIITNNFFKRTGSRVVLANQNSKGGRVIFSNNIIEDWGYEDFADGAGYVPSPFPMAVHVSSVGGIFTGNTFRFYDWDGLTPEATSPRRAFHIIEATLTSEITIQPTGNIIDGNTISDCGVGIFESTGATGNRGMNTFIDVPTPINTLPSGSTSKYGIATDAGIVSPYFSQLSVGRTTAIVDNTPGFVVGPLFTAWHTIDGTALGTTNYRINRTVNDGAYMRFYKDAIGVGGDISSLAGNVIIRGGLKANDFNLVDLPSATTHRAVMFYLNNPVGNKHMVFSDGTIWRYMDGTAV